MSPLLSQKPPRPVDAERLLRPQAKIDLILEMDFLTGQADVRNSMILDILPSQIVIAQTSPPILKSMLGQEVEASLVHHNLITYEASRWGWRAVLRGLDNQYRLNAKDPESEPISVISISRPKRPELERSNVRQAYRLEAGGRDGITIEVTPEAGRLRLLNFSAGGLMLATPLPSAYSLGGELEFALRFPEEAPLPLHLVKGRASIVRLEFDRGDKDARLGLKFHELSPEDARALPKIISHYMLEEQRRRNRDED